MTDSRTWFFCDTHPEIGRFSDQTILYKNHQECNGFRHATVDDLKDKTKGAVKHAQRANFDKQAVAQALDTCAAMQSPEALKAALQDKRGILSNSLKALLSRKDDDDKPITPTHDEIADIFEEQYDFARIGMDGKLMVRNNRTYVEEGEELIHKIMSEAAPKLKQSMRHEVVLHLGDKNQHKREEFDADPLIINAKNCFFDLKSGKEIEDEGYLSRMQIDTKYRPEMGRSELFEGSVKQAIPEQEKTFMEFCSSILIRDGLRLGKMMINVGDGRRGKSTHVLAVRNIFGTDKFSDAGLVQLEADKFKVSRLDGKWGNITTDISTGKLKSTDVTKKLVFHEPTDAERKGIDSYTLVFTGRLIFVCNELPELEKYERSFMNRVILVLWTGKEYDLDEKYQDSFGTEDEKSRILNTLLHYARQILENKKLLHVQDADTVMSLWKKHSDITTRFIDEMITDEEDDGFDNLLPVLHPTLERTYTEYIRYCHDQGETPQSKSKLDAKLVECGYIQGRIKEGRIWGNMVLYVKKPDKKADKRQRKLE